MWYVLARQGNVIAIVAALSAWQAAQQYMHDIRGEFPGDVVMWVMKGGVA